MPTAAMQHTTAQRLEQLAQVYRDAQASDVMTRTLDKLFHYEADQCRAQLRQLTGDLAEYERQYGQSSREFYARYEGGHTDDRMDYVEWASLYQMAQRLEERLRLLENGTGA